MKAIPYFVAAALVLCGCQPKQTERSAIQKWEYKIVEVENNQHHTEDGYQSELATNSVKGLDDIAYSRNDYGSFNLDADLPLQNFSVDFSGLGQAGWELVAAIPQTETTHPVSHDEIVASVRTGKIIFIFKRPLQ